MATTVTANSPGAFPFTIEVLDPPLSTADLIAGQPPGTIRLEGRAMPYRPISFEGKQRVKTTWYPGNTIATQQVMGPTEEPTTINGVWKDKYLGNATAGNLVTLFDALRRSGSRVKVSWGALSVHGSVLGSIFMRVGIITRTKFTPDRPQDIAWELEFTWASQDESSASPIFATSIANPREGLTETSDALDKLRDRADAFLTRQLTNLTKLSDDLQSSLDEVTNAMADIAIILQVTASSTSIQDIPRASLERSISILGQGATAAKDLLDGFLELGDLANTASDDALTLLSYLGGKFFVFEGADEAVGTAKTTADSLTGQLFPDILAEVTPPEGTSLRDLAQRFYGDPDLWFIIANFNDITGTLVPPRPSGPSDDPGRPILIPNRMNGDFGSLQC